MLPEIDEIQRKRKSLGLTQKELAALVNVSQSLIAKIETKKVNPSYRIVKKIFDTFEELEKKSRITAKNLLTSNVVFARKNDKLRKCMELMRKHGYSQLPIIDRNNVVGSISEKTILDLISKSERISKILNKKAFEVMEEAFPIVKEDEGLPVILTLLQSNHAVLVSKKGKIVGIITKADLLKATNNK